MSGSCEEDPQIASRPSLSPRRAVAWPGLEELRRREAALESEWGELQEQGFGYRGISTLLTEGKLADQEREARLAQADQVQTGFLASLDEFQRLQHVQFMDQVVGELDHAVKTMGVFYGRHGIRSISLRQRRLQKLAARYRELEHLHGTAQDHRRIAVYQRFYAGVVDFSRRIRRLDPTMPRSPPSFADWLQAVGRGLLWAGSRLGTMLRLLVAALRMIHAALSKKSPPTGTPFTNRVDDFFRAYGALRGYEVQVTGREHLPRRSDEETVHLLAPAHRHGVTDNVTFSHLGLCDYLVFNAVDQLPLVPRFLKERAAHTRGLIPVGGGRGPAVERALAVLAEGVSRNLLIYPEGSVSEGFRGTRPPRRNFGEGLVRRIREQGHLLCLVPITYLDNARFLDLPPLSDTPEDRRLRVAVSPGLDAAAIDALLATGGGEMLNRMVRLAWLENLTTDDHCLLGQDRVAEIERRLDLELDGIRYWGSLEPAPVASRLRTDPEVPIPVCEEPFRGRRVRVFAIPSEARDAKGRIAIENLRGSDSTELLIGIRPPSHIYLNVGSTRFDGNIFRRLAVKNRDYLYPGIVIRFTGVPVKSINAIRRKLEEFGGREHHTLTCANSACQVIARAANIKIDDYADYRPFLPSHVLPTRTIRKLIERGVRNHSGKTVDYQIYNTDGRPLETILAEMRRAEIKIAKDHLEMATRGAWKSLVAALRKRQADRETRP
jgi:hypothetical protein